MQSPVRIRSPLGFVAVAFLLAGIASSRGQTPLQRDHRRLNTEFISDPLRLYDPDASRPVNRWGDQRAVPYYGKGAFRSVIEPAQPIGEVQVGDLSLPSPTPLPSVSPLPSPTIAPTPTVFPTLTPVPTLTPAASISPRPSPPPAATPAFPVPVPNPAPSVADLVRPVPAPASAAPSFVYLQQLTPVVEIWRESALTPELPARRGKHVGPVAIPANEVVSVRLQFGLLATGKSVVVTPSSGVILNPLQQILAIQPGADCVMSVGLSEGYSSGAIRFYCEGISTLLTFSRVVPETQPLSQRTRNEATR